jgi:hypothetical protein
MARAKASTRSRKGREKPRPARAPSAGPPAEREAIRIRWERRNIGLFGGGLGAVIVGFVLLSQGDMTLAPILLVTGYCILIPLAFIL